LNIKPNKIIAAKLSAIKSLQFNFLLQLFSIICKVPGYDIEKFLYAYPVITLGAYSRLLELDSVNDDSLAGDYAIYPTFEPAVSFGKYVVEKCSTEFQIDTN